MSRKIHRWTKCVIKTLHNPKCLFPYYLLPSNLHPSFSPLSPLLLPTLIRLNSTILICSPQTIPSSPLLLLTLTRQNSFSPPSPLLLLTLTRLNSISPP